MTETPKRRLLIVWHSRTGAARQLSEAAEAGALAAAREMNDERLQVDRLEAEEVQPEHLLAAHGYVFCAPENLASLSGAMKEFFDRNYYPVLDQLAGRPYGLAIAAGTDGDNARRQTERIATGWRLELAIPALIAMNGAQSPEEILAPKTLAEEHRDKAAEIGGTVAALLLL